MRVKAPAVAPAATVLEEATQGPRVPPGTYTVKLTKGDHVYTEQVNVVLDPRAKFSVADRKAQFELEMKVYKLIEHMTWGVQAIEGVRNGANQRAAKLPEKDAFRAQLKRLAAKCDDLRSKIVATKEGGMITGEERIREHLGQLYGAIDSYEGQPTDYQVARSDSLGHELQDVIDDFQKLTQRELPGINAVLKKEKLDAIALLPESDWQRKREAESALGGGGTQMERVDAHEKD
jgi:hypothetical protein